MRGQLLLRVGLEFGQKVVSNCLVYHFFFFLDFTLLFCYLTFNYYYYSVFYFILFIKLFLTHMFYLF